MDPWELVQEGRFAEAVAEYTTRIRQDPSSFNYSNRGIAHLNLGNLEAAIADFQTASCQSKNRGDSFTQRVGVGHWLAGREDEAVSAWRDSVFALDKDEIDYTDAAGGIISPSLLWFAAVRQGNVELRSIVDRSLSKTLKARAPSVWPAPIGLFILGRLEAGAMLNAASSVPVLRERQICQGQFYIAIRALLDGQMGDTRNGLQRCVEMTRAKLENEYYLARYELARLESAHSA